MKKLFLITSLLLLSVTLWAQSEFFNTVEFHNKTQGEIIYLFCSPADSEFWGPDVLGSHRTLEAGEKIEFYISYPHESDSFDFMAIDEYGSVYELYEKEITDGSPAKFVISLDSKTEELDLESLSEELVALEINNNTGFELFYLFISPSDSEMYGIDFMDKETTLPPGESISMLFLNRDTGIDYDIQGIDEDEDSYSFSLTLDPALGDQVVDINYEDLDS
ncbi:hypothetical protein [Oceanispirochaeta sp.]|jgi:hypothetical protein|uniref:hypothetical protein n=1 Tax=Oceanispirochaeta sp. TaxID=2035350 RepID=UPI00261DA4DA|nr:hypothetical protein [Oceanispirochaeta sp.]MDA3955477.1 hypothetical protein [Oceanispirochaeta sp.]